MDLNMFTFINLSLFIILINNSHAQVRDLQVEESRLKFDPNSDRSTSWMDFSKPNRPTQVRQPWRQGPPPLKNFHPGQRIPDRGPRRQQPWSGQHPADLFRQNFEPWKQHPSQRPIEDGQQRQLYRNPEPNRSFFQSPTPLRVSNHRDINSPSRGNIRESDYFNIPQDWSKPETGKRDPLASLDDTNEEQDNFSIQNEDDKIDDNDDELENKSLDELSDIGDDVLEDDEVLSFLLLSPSQRVPLSNSRPVNGETSTMNSLHSGKSIPNIDNGPQKEPSFTEEKVDQKQINSKFASEHQVENLPKEVTYKEPEIKQNTDESQQPSTLSDDISEEILDETEEEDVDPVDVLSAFGSSGFPTFPFHNKVVPIKESTAEDNGKSVDSHENLPTNHSATSENTHTSDTPHVQILIPTTIPPVWKLFPLLPPPTPPGKKTLHGDNSPQVTTKIPDGHRQSYGLSAASMYARLQPSLRQNNQTGPRQRVIPRPYRRRPVSPTSTTQSPTADDEELNETEDHFSKDYPDGNLEAQVDGNKTESYIEDLLTADKETVNEDDTDNIKNDEEKSKLLQRDEETDVVVYDDKAEEQDEIYSAEDNDGLKESGTRQQPEENDQHPEQKEHIPEDDDQKTTLKTTEQPIKSEHNEQNHSHIKNDSTTMTRSDSSESISTKIESPTDIKSLLRSAGSLSLSEVLQQKGMSLADLLKGGSHLLTQMKPVKLEDSDTKPTDITTVTTESNINTTPGNGRGNLPSVVPQVLSIRELLASNNMTAKDLVKTNESPAVISNENGGINSATLKPNVKLPTPFNPQRAKGLPWVSTTTLTVSASESEEEEDDISATVPSVTFKANLKPLLFGSNTVVKETTASPATTEPTSSETTTTTKPSTRSRRPYIPSNSVGEYGSHIFSDDDEEENSVANQILVYGNQRPIATSRLTPPPPRKQRPVHNFNYNTYFEEDENDDSSKENKTINIIITHFNEDEIKENHDYYDLPLSVQSAIIVSSAIGGFCLLVFLVILVVFKIRQKTRVRLRHPTALLGLGAASHITTVSDDSSGVTTPVSAPKGGYAKLPQRSNSLWGTLRRSVRKLETPLA